MEAFHASHLAECPSDVSGTQEILTQSATGRRSKEIPQQDRACENCRRKKRKCTFEKPSCSLCRQRRIECVYSGRRRKPGPEKGTKNRRKCALLDRIAELESILYSNPGPTDIQVLHRGDEVAQGSTASDVAAQTDYNPIELTQFLPIPPSASGSSYMDANSLVPPEPEAYDTMILQGLSTVNQVDSDQLLELYFHHMQPMLPLFCRPVFYEDLFYGRIPRELLAVMLALAARFSPHANLAQNTDYHYWHDILSQPDSRYKTGISVDLDINSVKKECLLTIYEYTQFPGDRAWTQAGRMIRAAIGCGLHQIDCPKSRGNITEEEREEHRFVWWTIYKLDTSLNGVALTPLGINDDFISTFLVSNSIEDFTAGTLRPSLEDSLQTGPWGFEQVFRHDSLDRDLDCDRISIRFISLLRELHVLRCLLGLKSKPEHRDRLEHIASVCFFINASFPEWFSSPARRLELQETSSQHQRRLETLLEFKILRIQSELPIFSTNEIRPDEINARRWQNCVSYAEDISSIFTHWDAAYDGFVNPITSYAIWYASTILLIQVMSTSSELGTSGSTKSQLEAAVDVMYASLHRLSVWWPLANKLIESIDELRPWMWLHLSWSEVKILIDRLHVLLDPKDSSSMHIHVHISKALKTH